MLPVLKRDTRDEEAHLAPLQLESRTAKGEQRGVPGRPLRHQSECVQQQEEGALSKPRSLYVHPGRRRRSGAVNYE